MLQCLKKKKYFGVGHGTATSHLKNRLFFLKIPLQQDTSFVEMEEVYRLSQQRAEIAWQQQSKGEKKNQIFLMYFPVVLCNEGTWKVK